MEGLMKRPQVDPFNLLILHLWTPADHRIALAKIHRTDSCLAKGGKEFFLVLAKTVFTIQRCHLGFLTPNCYIWISFLFLTWLAYKHCSAFLLALWSNIIHFQRGGLERNLYITVAFNVLFFFTAFNNGWYAFMHYFTVLFSCPQIRN